MNPSDLIAPAAPTGLPAPFWFIELFKVLGFALHAVMMNIWFAGIIIAMVLGWRGSTHQRHIATRIMNAMPIIIAIGINLGIVPLLFLQLAYYRVFYPATILMAWPWMGVIALLLVAYYSVYIYVVNLRTKGEKMPGKFRAFGWLGAILFVAISFLFVNAMTLMANPGNWLGIWKKTSFAGAVYGIGLNLGDPMLWPRWLMFFGLAITTTAAFIAFDAGMFARKEAPEYRATAGTTSLVIYTIGIVIFALMGYWYMTTWPTEIRAHMMQGQLQILTLATGLALGLPWLLILWQRKNPTSTGAILIAITQFAVIGLNATSRQIKQNLQLSSIMDLTKQPVHTQTIPLLIFLALFVIALGIVIWMITKITKAAPHAEAKAG